MLIRTQHATGILLLVGVRVFRGEVSAIIVAPKIPWRPRWPTPSTYPLCLSSLHHARRQQQIDKVTARIEARIESSI